MSAPTVWVPATFFDDHEWRDLDTPDGVYLSDDLIRYAWASVDDDRQAPAKVETLTEWRMVP